MGEVLNLPATLITLCPSQFLWQFDFSEQNTDSELYL